MRVFLAGATGAIGRRLLPQLVARGHQVTATTRSANKLAELRALGADAVVVDGLDAAAVGEAVARAEPDAIIHQMTALSGKPDLRHFDRWFALTNELRRREPSTYSRRASAVGVARFVAQSYTGWTNARTGGPVKTEDDPLDPSPAKEQRRVAGGDSVPREVGARGAARGDRAALRQLLRTRCIGVARRAGPQAPDSRSSATAQGVWSWIHVDDAAAATVAALERGKRGVYNIVDDEPAPVSEWLSLPRRGRRREAAAARPGLARSARRRRGRGGNDDRSARRLERKGEAGARLAACLVELARGLPCRGMTSAQTASRRSRTCGHSCSRSPIACSRP